MRHFILMSALMASACGGTAPAEPPFTSTARATFNEPWAMAFLPGSGVAMTNMALVTERAGTLLLVDTATGISQKVQGTPKVAYAGQGGLGDVIVHPDFAGNQFIYLSWAEAGKGGNGAAVGRAKLILGKGAPQLEGLQVIWRQEPKVSGSGHFGHRMAFGPDGMLYVSSGERQKFDPAQNPDMNLGKIVRLTDGGMIPSDNPWYDQGRVRAQAWTAGHRNPLGLAFDGAGRLWEIEMGPKGGDELNLIIRSANYGWPRVSDGSHYDGRDIPDHAPGDGYQAPKVWWNPSISPGSLMIYSGKLFPKWQGDAFIGALSGEALIRVDLDGDKASKAEQWPMGARIREVEQGPDGAIWVLEDGPKARLLRLDPARKQSPKFPLAK